MCFVQDLFDFSEWRQSYLALNNQLNDNLMVEEQDGLAETLPIPDDQRTEPNSSHQEGEDSEYFIRGAVDDNDDTPNWDVGIYRELTRMFGIDANSPWVQWQYQRTPNFGLLCETLSKAGDLSKKSIFSKIVGNSRANEDT